MRGGGREGRKERKGERERGREVMEIDNIYFNLFMIIICSYLT